MHKNGITFLPLVALGEKPGDCWNWIGRVAVNGYGKKQFHGKTMLAHRWVYQQLFGPIPAGKVINHICRNRSCVNPHHLEVTTHAGNSRHGRTTKLTAAQVVEIKAALPTLRWGDRKKLAARMGVSPGLISDIKYGRAWI